MSLKNYLIYLLLYVNLFGFSGLYAQVRMDIGKRLTTIDGLLNDNIYCVAQTEDGFVWIGSREGLSRFDGTNFKHFFHDPNNPQSLGNNQVQALMADGTSLWIATQIGLSKLNLQTEQFNNYQLENCFFKDSIEYNAIYRILSLAKGSKEEIWIGTSRKALFRYFPAKDSLQCYRYAQEKVADYFPNPQNIDCILSIKVDQFNPNITWAGTMAGLLKINTLTDSIYWYLYPEKAPHLFIPQNSIRKIYQHDDGLLYFGSWGAKVNLFNPKTEEFSALALNNKSKAEQQEGAKILNAATGEIIRKSAHEIWITTTLGLMEYNTQRQVVQKTYWNKIKNEEKYGLDFIDAQNRAWYGTNTGLYRFDPIEQQFITYDFLEHNQKGYGYSYYFSEHSPHGDIAIIPRDADGIFHLDVAKKHWKKTPIPARYKNLKDAFTPRGISRNPLGFWTLINDENVFNFYPKEEKFENIPLPNGLKNQRFRAILWDTKGQLWIGTQTNGLFCWTPSINRWYHFKKELAAPNAPNRGVSVSRLFEDSQKNIWIKRYNGFSVYDAKQDTIYNFLYDLVPEKTDRAVNFFTEDKLGKVWMIAGTKKQLLQADVKFPEKGVLKKINYPKEFQIAAIGYLKSDANGDVWALSNDGLYKIDVSSHEVTTYSLEYGIRDKTFFGFDILKDNRLVLGGKNKIWIAQPEDLRMNKELPKPYLTGISVLEEPLKSDVSIENLKQLNLAHWENFFSFDFSAIAHTLGKSTQYRYQLEGLGDHWIDAGNRRSVNYTNVPSGNYIFKLQAANNEGIWNESSYQLPIFIATPWWRETWFYLVASLLLIGTVYGVYRLRIRQIRQQEQLKSDFEKQILKVEMNALRAQMNPHFLFNCLNSIERFIIKNDTLKASEYLNDFARLIRLILQNSRANYISLADELETLELYLRMESLRFIKQFNYQITVDAAIQPDNFNIPPMLIQPFIENAIWHGLMHKADISKGNLKIDFTQQNAYLICTVEDDGIGRAAAQAIKNRRIDSSKKSLGMKITKDRIAMLNRLHNVNTSIEIIDLVDDDGIGCGTRVVLKIPF